MHLHLAVCAVLAVTAFAIPRYNTKAFDSALSKPQGSDNSSSLLIDLGYEQYMGVANASTGLNTWKGIRFAAPPTGSLRWQPPQAPTINRDQVLQANSLPQRCPQSAASGILSSPNITGNEDCLFLSVYAPPNAISLPVFVWIHGGGYGVGQGDQDTSAIINANHDSFIAVVIQYRVSSLMKL